MKNHIPHHKITGCLEVAMSNLSHRKDAFTTTHKIWSIYCCMWCDVASTITLVSVHLNSVYAFSLSRTNIKMPTCAAVGCDNRQGECNDKSVSFHRFPINNQILLKKWVENLDRGQHDNAKAKVKKTWKPSGKSILCSKHFTQDCFEEDKYVKYGLKPSGKEVRKLKEGAVPTIFPHKEKKTNTRTHTEQRLKRKATQEVIVFYLM